MNILDNEKGVALITVLLFSLIAIGVVTGAYYMTLSATRTSGIEKRYVSELDVNKGTSDFIIGRLLRNNLQCNGGNTCVGDTTPASCAAASTIDISSTVCAALGKQTTANGCENLTACYMSLTTITEIDPITSATNIIELVSVNVVSTNPDRGERADIDFVVRIE